MTNPEDPRTEKFDRSTDQQGPNESAAQHPTEVHHTADPYQAYGYVPDEQPTSAYPTYPAWDPNAPAQPTQAYPTQQGGQYPDTQQQAWGQTSQPYPGQQYPNPTQAYPTQQYGQPYAQQQQQQYPGQTGPQTQQWGGYPGEAPPLEQSGDGGGDGPKKPKTLLYVLAGLVALALIIGAVALFTGGSKDDDSTSSASGATTEIVPALPSEPSEAPRVPSTPRSQPGENPPLPPGVDSSESGGAAVGKIDTNDGSTLTVSGVTGGSTTVHTDDKTSVVSLSGGKVSDLKVGDTVVIQGSKSADGTLLAKIIISTSMPHGGFGGN